jgi:glycosyltransferase involved in cell wall biosynthesis
VSPLRISVFIIALNEEDRITRAVQSVIGWVDEVIVVDAGSSDATASVAAALGAKVVAHKWEGFGKQRQFSEAQCRNDWILSLDADECITPGLRGEICALFQRGEPDLVAYGAPILLVYPGWEKPRPFARDHWAIRLYNKRVVRYRDSDLYDSVELSGLRPGRLKGEIYHYSIRSLSDLRQKLDERAWLAANTRGPGQPAGAALRLLTELPLNFIKYYFGRRHFMGGVQGLVYAWTYAWYRFVRIYRVFRHGQAAPD